MRVLVTGAKGRLGSRLTADLEAAGYAVRGVDLDEIDITNYAAVRALCAAFEPELVVHAAAWTDVDGCARDPQRALIQNGFGAGFVARAAAAVDAAVLYISSNEVFDGTSSRPYFEYDRANPVNPYGASKWAGEQMVRDATPLHYIVRTSWLFARGGRNFIHAILGAARDRKPLRVVTDEIACPTSSDELAGALVRLIQTGRCGTYHLVNEGYCSRYEFARTVLDLAGLTDVPIEPIRLAEWPRPSTPPPFTPLTNVAGALAGITLQPWRDAVAAFIAADRSTPG